MLVGTKLTLFKPILLVSCGTDCYFVHSFHFVPDDYRSVLATTPYCGEFASIVKGKSLWGPVSSGKKLKGWEQNNRKFFEVIETMLKVRVIPTLLWKTFNLVKGKGFNSWRQVGSVMPSIKVYNTPVDELILLDISATDEQRNPIMKPFLNFVMSASSH